MISTTGADIAREVPIGDLETLRLLASGRRHAIVQALTPRAMTAKELAGHLGTVPTKLYYHLNILESAGIIRVAEERIVSGIVERSYRAAARSFVVDRSLLSANEADVADAQAVILDETAAEYRKQRRRPASTAETVEPLIARSYLRCSPQKLQALHARLHELLADADDSGDGTGEAVCLAVAFFAVGQSDESP